ncbi:MAG: AbrB/MazE/SpoVT family DNA-binding domain-containing protein [Candidatus Latescibacterota bacterium]
MPTATLTRKGQTTIPKGMRDHLGLRAGDRIDFVIDDHGNVLMRPAVATLSELKGLLRHRVRQPVTIEEMNAAVRGRSGAAA